MQRCGSHSTICAPMPTSLSVKNMRLGYIQSWNKTLPLDWVPTTMAMLIKSVGNEGQGITLITGIASPRSGSTISFCCAGITILSLTAASCRVPPSYMVSNWKAPISVQGWHWCWLHWLRKDNRLSAMSGKSTGVTNASMKNYAPWVHRSKGRLTFKALERLIL